jgi:hypothetical protein
MYEIKTSRLFCSQNSLKCKMRAVYCLSCIFTLLSICFLTWSSVKVNRFNRTNNTYSNLSDASAEVSRISLLVLVPLTLVITFYYICLRSSLSKFTSVKLERQKNNLNRFFTVFLATTLLRLFFNFLTAFQV